ncbi:MAG TPA: recombinase family protein [Terriglobales bacterium]|nr:recombinase family protein [Terriglobales bacterium]
MAENRSIRCVLYARVSTLKHGQDCEVQLRELRQHASARGWEVVHEYIDAGVSGSKESRPQLNQLMTAACRREFDIVAVHRFDRFARSTRHLLMALEEFKSLGVGFVSYSEALDTSTPLGAAMFTILGAISQLEKDIIRERVIAGLRHAKSKGIKLGRPAVPVDVDAVRAARARGLSWRAVGLELGIAPMVCLRAARAVTS